MTKHTNSSVPLSILVQTALKYISRINSTIIQEKESIDFNFQIIDEVYLSISKKRDRTAAPNTAIQKAAYFLYDYIKTYNASVAPRKIGLITAFLILHRKNHSIHIPQREVLDMLQWIEVSSKLNEKEVLSGLVNIFTKYSVKGNPTI
jgi:hypothetical protein